MRHSFPPASAESLSHWLGRIVGPVTALEAFLAAAIVALALAAPTIGRTRFAKVERSATALLASPARQILAVGLLAVVARAVFLPWLGPPIPLSHDEHSYVLQAQTFLAGRLANPTPAFWEHFEAIHLNVVPAYASMYFPGRSLPLVLGMVLADNAWIGVWISFVLMCMAAVWMLQGWVPAFYALLGGMLVVLRLGIFSYWVNSYWGGAFTAFGAMLVLGAVPRILKQPSWGMGLVMAVGASILLLNRPVEGALVCLPLMLFLLFAMWRARGYPFGRMLVRVGAPVALLVAASGGWVLAYNQATTGDALATPYDLNRQTYAITPAFLTASRFNGEQRGPAYFREFYNWEDIPYNRRSAPSQMIRGVLAKIYYSWNFYVGFILTPAFLAGLWASRRRPVLPVTLGAFLVGYSFQTWNFPHYTAPVFPVVLIVTMMGFEWLRQWTVRGRETGLFLTRAMPLAVALTLLVPASAAITGYPKLVSNAASLPCCTLLRSSLRTEITARLRALPGRDLVLISTERLRHPVHSAMLYNEPDIAAADIVWAHLLGPDRDNPMLAHYSGRQVWELRWREDGSYVLAPRPRQSREAQ